MKPVFQKVAFCSLFLLLTGFAFAQQTRVFVDTYSSQKAWRNREGGGEPVSIDTVTALPELIKRLNNNWELVETGKGYWIGYTDDMYSIAAHGETAVAPLLAVAQHAPLEQSRRGAVYSLHLIGINSREAGRFYEEFTNLSARQALRSLLLNQDLKELVVELLLRDPWQSDVPVLMAALEKTTPQDWVLTNATTHYHLTDMPINQPIDEDIGNQRLTLPKRQKFSGVADWTATGHSQAHRVLLTIRNMKPPHFILEPDIENQPVESHLSNDAIINNKQGYCVRTYLEELAGTGVFGFGYPRLGTALQYYIDEQNVTVCSTATARQRVLVWWKAQPLTYQQQVNINKAWKPVRR
jgi:hypothetical protein